VDVPALTDYSTAELERAKALSPALANYLNPQAVFGNLARRRHDLWSRAALATLLKKSTPQTITKFWSDSADLFLSEAWASAGLDTLPAVLLGLGKLGAQELNLSSDVDLIVVSEPRALEATNSALRKFRHILGSGGVADHVLRLDFDLRPGGRFGPVITTMNQMRDY
jgi:[glutamine synthetase] adenylyltransferase / [glutamine synthetase]-adenylyl-L-tyrosine phosphorylase